MATGTVKWFNNAKGYGFILPDEGGEDLFAHYSAIQMEGYKTLKAGQDVEYELEDGDKGLHALNITAAGSEQGAADLSAHTSHNGETIEENHVVHEQIPDDEALSETASQSATPSHDYER